MERRGFDLMKAEPNAENQTKKRYPARTGPMPGFYADPGGNNAVRF